MAHKAERGLFELRQGRALHVTGAGSDPSVLVTAVESVDRAKLGALREVGGSLSLVVTHHRAHALGFPSVNGDRFLSVALSSDQGPETVLRLATARAPVLGDGIAGLRIRPATGPEASALALARFGRLLPALVSVPAHPDNPTVRAWLEDGTVLGVTHAEIEALVQRPGIEVTHVTEAPVPLADAEGATFMYFREGGGFLEHVAVLIGDRREWPDPPPVRLHSACLTGDLFGSLRCDCGDQLRGSLRYFSERGGGVLVYLAQEGRGIGLGNKIRAYQLQEEGLDTVDADGVLGFGPDERQYDQAVAMLEHLGINRVHLLTNNPEKVRALESGGIRVEKRVPIHGSLSRHNLRYVKSKIERTGHWLDDMIRQRIPGD